MTCPQHERASERESFPQPDDAFVRVGEHEYVSVRPDPDNPDMVIVRTRKRVRKKHRRKARLSRPARIALGIAAALLLLALGAGVCVAALVHAGEANLRAGNQFDGMQAAPEEVRSGSGDTIEYQGVTYRYNENVIGIVLIGHDDETGYVTREGASCADVICVLAFDTSTNQLKAIMVPRNTCADVDVYNEGAYVDTRPMPIALSYAVDVPTEQQCAQNTALAVSRLFYGLPLSSYIAIDEQAFAQFTDAVGGVTLEALSSIPGASYRAGDTVHLDGQQAFAYIRYRDSSVFESALERQQRQIQFMQAFAQKAKSLGVTEAAALAGAAADNVVTNLSAADIAYLASCFVTGPSTGVELMSLEGQTQIQLGDGGEELEYYYLEKESIMGCMLAAFFLEE